MTFFNHRPDHSDQNHGLVLNLTYRRQKTITRTANMTNLFWLAVKNSDKTPHIKNTNDL